MINSIVALKPSLDPFKGILDTLISELDVSNLKAKTKAIQAIIKAMEDIETDAENYLGLTHWGRIASGFSFFLCASTFSINPLVSLLLCATSGVSSASIFGLTFANNTKVKQSLDKIKRYRIALKSDTPINWAAIWDLSGVDLFCDALYEASTGRITSDNRNLDRFDGKKPLTVAVEFVSQYHNVTREQFADLVRQLKAGSAAQLPKPAIAPVTPTLEPSVQTLSIHTAPTTLQLPHSDKLYQTALDILEGLVKDADQSKLGGCIILASPGAGKTTFLGAAWGRLKAKFGDNFKSLAVVVKHSDLQAFKNCSDNAMCADTAPVDAAIAIIKFIDESMHHDGNVKRLFLDDYLTMKEGLEMSCKGLFINPKTGAVYMDRKEAKEAQDYNAVGLYDCLNQRLNKAWLVGREYNLSLYISSHSSNVDSLPFITAKEVRSVGDLIFLAKNNKRDFIEQALNNPNLIADNNKRQQLKSIIDSQSSDDEPWVLANFNNWSLGIVTSLIRQEYEDYRRLWDNKVTAEVRDRAIKSSSEKEQLEYLFSLPSVQEVKPLPSHPLAPKIVEIITKSQNNRVRFDSIRKNRGWDKTPQTEHIREAIQLLIQSEIIDGDDENGYMIVR